MKRTFILILAFLAAVAISPLLINEKGYILIAMGELTIESTVVTAVIMLVLLFISLLFSLKILRGGLNLGFGAWRKVVFANQRRGIRNFNKGIACYILGDFKEAEQLLAKSAEASQFANTAYLMAASSAQKQQLENNSQHYLDLIQTDNNAIKHLGLDSVLVRIKLYLLHKDYGNARELIDQYHKHIGHDARLLTLEIDLCLIEQRYLVAIDYLVMARKEKSIAEETINNWEDKAFYHQFEQLLLKHDSQALSDYFQQLPRKVKSRESVILSYCQVLAENNISESLTKFLLSPLKKDASPYFLKRLRHLPLSNANELIAVAQKHLHKNQQSSKWLSTIAHLAAASEQWTLAEKAFTSLLLLTDEQYDNHDLEVFAQVYQAQEKYQLANDIYQKIIKLK